MAGMCWKNTMSWSQIRKVGLGDFGNSPNFFMTSIMAGYRIMKSWQDYDMTTGLGLGELANSPNIHLSCCDT